MNFAIAYAVHAFCRTKSLARRLRTRDDVLRWRKRQLDRFLRDVVMRVPFYAAAPPPTRLEDLPIIDKQIVLANFDKLNVKGVPYQAVRDALDAGGDRVDGLIVGQSTGTSGNRGVFVISEAERFTWLGVMLGKALPDFPFVRHKVALALPGFNPLYASASETGRLALRFFDLTLGVDAWRDDLCTFAPDTIVAPPKVLRALAETSSLRPSKVFSGAEVLDPLDREIVEARFGSRVREIYMATEGLFGVGCKHGVLHLAEDAVAFEFEPAPGGLVSPLVTDFTRSTQIMARYRMNDLLRLSDEPCGCGSPLQRVASVEGRQDDVFLIVSGEGKQLLVTPDIMRNAVIDADRRIQDFRIVQVGADRIVLSLATNVPSDAARAASAALKRAVGKAGAANVVIDLRSGIETPYDRKLRRVRREWWPA
ncbi:MAG: F390 synthetase-related protein [Terricaulis sp.]